MAVVQGCDLYRTCTKAVIWNKKRERTNSGFWIENEPGVDETESKK